MPLKAKSLYFSYTPNEQLFSGLSLSLNPRQKVALVGPNGSGKTTLLRLLAGAITPDKGMVSVAGGVLLLEQHMTSADEPASGGELRLTALRRVFAANGAALLLDEPSNDLDEDAREWLRHTINQSPLALVIISHDPMVLDLVDEIWELQHGGIVKHPPGYQAFLDRLNEEEARLTAEIGSLNSRVKKADARARTLSEAQQKRMARGEKQGVKANLPKILRGALKRQAQGTLAKVETTQEDRGEAIKTQVRELKSRLRSMSMFAWDSRTTRAPATKVLVRFREFMLPGFTRPLSYEMTGPRRVRLLGKNGSGKSTMLRALCGDPDARKRVTGEAFLARPFQMFDQSLSQFSSDEALCTWFQAHTQLEVSLARTILGRLGFDQDEQFRAVSALSGGERVRLELALALHTKEAPQILLLDEPTNHLDIESRRILYRFIEAFEGGIILVSHDHAFAASLSFDDVINLDEFR